jgi:hypothetical protein
MFRHSNLTCLRTWNHLILASVLCKHYWSTVMHIIRVLMVEIPPHAKSDEDWNICRIYGDCAIIICVLVAHYNT